MSIMQILWCVLIGMCIMGIVSILWGVFYEYKAKKEAVSAKLKVELPNGEVLDSLLKLVDKVQELTVIICEKEIERMRLKDELDKFIGGK